MAQVPFPAEFLLTVIVDVPFDPLMVHVVETQVEDALKVPGLEVPVQVYVNWALFAGVYPVAQEIFVAVLHNLINY